MTQLDPSLVAEGYRRARDVAKAHAKSFYVASFALFGARRRAAFALYAFCRRLDDLVDGQSDEALKTLPSGLETTAQVTDVADLSRRLSMARAMVASLYDEKVTGPSSAEGPWHPAEFAALTDTLRRFDIPQQPFQDLISGMEMDLTLHRYQTAEELDLYCYRVAGTVGLMLTPVLGFQDVRALRYAADLGRAMQLTNILRDVREDLSRGRCYLPAQELAAYGLTAETLATSPRFPEYLQVQIRRARETYARAMLGVPMLTGFGSQRMVALMAALYSRILSVIERRRYDVFSGRASLSMGRKLWVALGTLLRPRAALEPSIPLRPS